MLIFNTTYQVSEAHARNFLIWLTQSYIPTVLNNGCLKEPRLAEVLSHGAQEKGRTYSLQFEVENSAKLHEWHSTQGIQLNTELVEMFKEEVVGFPTLMEKLDL